MYACSHSIAGMKNSEFLWGWGSSCFLCVLHVAAPETSWSFDQRSPTASARTRACGCVCVCLTLYDLVTSTMRLPRRDLGCNATKKDICTRSVLLHCYEKKEVTSKPEKTETKSLKENCKKHLRAGGRERHLADETQLLKRHLFQQPDIAVTMKAAKMRWLANTGMSKTAVHKRPFSAQCWGYRRPGWPKLRWLDFVTEELANAGVRNCKRRINDL